MLGIPSLGVIGWFINSRVSLSPPESHRNELPALSPPAKAAKGKLR